MRRDEFKSSKDLVKPNSPHVAIVQYHKIRCYLLPIVLVGLLSCYVC